MQLLFKYFPELTADQARQFEALGPLYAEWNARINVISRKDMDHFYERHVLHSLSIAKIYPLDPFSRILDVGTGGGFPGIPLAILYPDISFVLSDSIRKKTVVATEVARAIDLKNVVVEWARSETIPGPFDAVVTRAVAPAEQLIRWIAPLTKKMLALKGGDLTEECAAIPKGRHRLHPVSKVFDEAFFETKYVLEWTK